MMRKMNLFTLNRINNLCNLKLLKSNIFNKNKICSFTLKNLDLIKILRAETSKDYLPKTLLSII